MNVWSNCTLAERPFKEARHKIMVERGIIFSADIVMPPQILRKDVIKSVHDNIYGGVAATQRRLKLQAEQYLQEMGYLTPLSWTTHRNSTMKA